MADILIRNAEIWQRGVADLRIRGQRVAAIGQFAVADGETVLDAGGAALLPGLHDHHTHLAALAAKNASIPCGPPDVIDAAALSAALMQPGTGWLRGIGYHESVAGMLDARGLDHWVDYRPVRIQHRSGRMWFLNSAALDALLAQGDAPPGMERADGRYTGRLFDEDRWLRETLGGVPPCFAAISAQLATMGVTGLTDVSPANDGAMLAHFRAEQLASRLGQAALIAGTLALADADFSARLQLGPAKLHLHEAALPDLVSTATFIAEAHEQGRGVAIHCTTEVELVFALAVLRDAVPMRGDRIEHAGIAPDPLIEQIAEMDLWVVSQPHFIAERGDQYLVDVAPRDHAALYRLQSFRRAGITLAGGSDAPFGGNDPWASMTAAVSRTTQSGQIIGAREGLNPEEAISLYLADPLDLTCARQVEPGSWADLCLLDRPWDEARLRLSARDVSVTISGGRILHNRIDQAPA